jgi:hypothetical protein
MDLAIDGDEGEEAGNPEEKAEEALDSVEDALGELKAAFAEIMGDDSAEDEMDVEEAFEEVEEVEESESEETLEEEAKLSAVSVSHPDNTDGKAGPVGPGMKDPFSHVDSEKSGDDMMSKGGTEKGGKAPAAKDMGATSPQNVKDLKPAPKAKG